MTLESCPLTVQTAQVCTVPTGREEGLKAFLRLSLAHAPSRAVTAVQELETNRDKRHSEKVLAKDPP